MATAIFQRTFLIPATSLPMDLFSVRVQDTESLAYTYLTEGDDGRWSADLEWGTYNVEYQEEEGGAWTLALEDVWHGTADAKTHAEGTTDKHECHDELVYTPTTAADWDTAPEDPGDALDELADRVTDIEDWDADDIPYTPTTAADWDEPNPTETEGALDQLAERLRDLEEGEATAPAGIDDFLDSLGVVIGWDAQDVNDIQYAVKWLWKHRSESAALIDDMRHQKRTLAADELIPYFTRRVDLSSSPDTDLILYYAIAARGRADEDWVWSAVQSIEVEIPEYSQEFRAAFSGMAFRCDGTGASGGRSEYFLAVREPNQFPSADATPPTRNSFVIPAGTNSYQYTEIGFQAEVLPDDDVELILRNSVTGATKTFTINSATGRIATAAQAFLLEVLSGAELQIYTLDAKNMGDVHIWLRRTLYTG